MANLSFREVNQSQLESAPIVDGQLIVCKDTGNMYRDFGMTRVQTGRDIEIVAELPLAPINGKVYCLLPDELYVYNGDWIKLNDPTYELSVVKQSENKVGVSLKNKDILKSTLSATGVGITTVSVNGTGELLVQTPEPDNLLARITDEQIDALFNGEYIPEPTYEAIIGRIVLG